MRQRWATQTTSSCIMYQSIFKAPASLPKCPGVWGAEISTWWQRGACEHRAASSHTSCQSKSIRLWWPSTKGSMVQIPLPPSLLLRPWARHLTPQLRPIALKKKSPLELECVSEWMSEWNVFVGRQNHGRCVWSGFIQSHVLLQMNVPVFFSFAQRLLQASTAAAGWTYSPSCSPSASWRMSNRWVRKKHWAPPSFFAGPLKLLYRWIKVLSVFSFWLLLRPLVQVWVLLTFTSLVQYCNN